MLDFIIGIYIYTLIALGFLCAAWIVRSAVYVIIEDKHRGY